MTHRSDIATVSTTNIQLLLLLRSRSTDKQFVKRVRDVVFSKETLEAAKLLPSRDAQKVINKLDKVRATPPPIFRLLMVYPGSRHYRHKRKQEVLEEMSQVSLQDMRSPSPVAFDL